MPRGRHAHAGTHFLIARLQRVTAVWYRRDGSPASHFHCQMAPCVVAAGKGAVARTDANEPADGKRTEFQHFRRMPSRQAMEWTEDATNVIK